MNRILIDLPEVIETPRLILHMPKAGFGKKLYEAIIEGYHDGVEWLGWPSTEPTMESVEEDCRKYHADFILREFIRYIIIEKATDMGIGRCTFPSFQVNWDIPQVGIAYFIRRSYRSKGYATEAAHAMTQLAFSVLKARKVEIRCDDESTPSRRVAEKLNFELEYTQKGGRPRLDGALSTHHTYALFSEEMLLPLEVKW